jgi:hypothetical protein
VCDKCSRAINESDQAVAKTVINGVEYDLCDECRAKLMRGLESKGRRVPPILLTPPHVLQPWGGGHVGSGSSGEWLQHPDVIRPTIICAGPPRA